MQYHAVGRHHDQWPHVPTCGCEWDYDGYDVYGYDVTWYDVWNVASHSTRSAFDQDRGRIVAYQDCGLSFGEIGSRLGRIQTTVMRICDRWMQEGTTNRRGRLHPPQFTTSREDRQIVRMVVTDRSDSSRTVAQHIESVTHHSVSARTIRRRLQQSGLSARRPLLRLPLTQNHRHLRLQWCYKRRMWVAE
ncbi:transposable element Tcb1 transposase [Trichonephila clavipes]|nr:transposable element Tcb1 transposase [Trichonephila clavipes]